MTDNGEQHLEPGMCFGFAAGGTAHYLINLSDKDATYREVGDRSATRSATQMMTFRQRSAPSANGSLRARTGHLTDCFPRSDGSEHCADPPRQISPWRLSWSSVRQLLSRLTKSISWSTHIFQPSWKPISSCRRRPASSLWSTTTE